MSVSDNDQYNTFQCKMERNMKQTFGGKNMPVEKA